jgi:rubrerythrin
MPQLRSEDGGCVMLRIERKDYENAKKHGHRICTAEAIELSLRIAMKYEHLDKDTCERVFDMLQNAPVFDPEELRPKGHWIKRGNEKKCSVCGFVYYSNNDEWNGCPNCLSVMGGERRSPNV